MLALVFSVLSSSIIFVIFKLFERFQISTLQAIVFNYFTAFTLGYLLFHDDWTAQMHNESNWLIWAGFVSIFFIGLFNVMSHSSQINGVASTSIAVKMSMAVSLLLIIIGYGEEIGLLKIIGIILAFIGVFMISYNKSTGEKGSAVWMLILLFFGSGALDFLLNYLQKFQLQDVSLPLFTAFGLGFAGIIGGIILTILIIKGKEQFEFKNIIAGILLGIPNYFSIYLLLLSYQSINWMDSTVLAVNNVSIVLLSALIGFGIFKERLTSKKLIGLIAAVLAIIILYYAA